MTAHLPTAMPRLLLGYGTLSASHKATLHLAPGTDSATAITDGAAVANQLKRFLFSTQSFATAEYIAANSNVSNPVPWTAVVGTLTPGTATTNRANMLTFVGRTVAGCRARLTMFTDAYGPDANYRLTSAEDAGVSAMVAWLNTTSSPIVALDGLAPVWKAYANISPARYWVKRLRRG